jgi:hypothetical protein
LIPTEQTEGKCMKLEPVPANGACPGEADECPTDYFCDPKAKICLPAADLGDVCDPINHPCKTGMTCPGGPFVVTCTGKWDQGHACRADTDCASNICARQPDSADGNCADEITLSPLDATCAQFKGPVTGQ